MRGAQQKLRLTSCPNSVNAVEPFVETLAERYQISGEKYGDILISVTEAVTNAIRHGNNEDQNKTVEVSLIKQKHTLAISVSDQGCGFDYHNLPDPTHPDHICTCGGRGVFLMRELSDSLTFRNNGSTVEMKFKL